MADEPTNERIPAGLNDAVARAIADVAKERAIFVMMRYQETPQFEEIIKVIESTLGSFRFEARLARDKAYVTNLWDNVRVYMHACSFGIAVFEEIDARSFNPNVAMEVGYMYALGKRTLLLKERRMPVLPTDIAGEIYRSFDSYRIADSVGKEVEGWLQSDLGLHRYPVVAVVNGGAGQNAALFVATLAAMLSVSGYRVRSSETESADLEWVRSAHPDLILLMEHPPVLNFADSKRAELRKISQAPTLLLRFVQLTGHGSEIPEGADDVIVMPFEAEELEAKIERMTRPAPRHVTES